MKFLASAATRVPRVKGACPSRTLLIGAGSCERTNAGNGTRCERESGPPGESLSPTRSASRMNRAASLRRDWLSFATAEAIFLSTRRGLRSSAIAISLVSRPLATKRRQVRSRSVSLSKVAERLTFSSGYRPARCLCWPAVFHCVKDGNGPAKRENA